RRAETLEGRGAVSQSEFALRRRERAVAEARVAEMEARVSDRILRAPFDGIIGLRQISAGATVSPGDVIARLVDTQTLKLDFSVPASVLGALEPGAQIEARLRGGWDRPVQGSVASIDSVIDPVTRSVLVRAHVPNED
ncbi:efflux RND transporter periplasmic adaptor subunit, partial [bacterium LRH843]|nr:efflux RND transporter periplasmic adaptor subunit [bacterium LRH843]